MDGNCGNVMAFDKFFIPSLISFNSLTRPSFKSLFMFVTGLKSFEILFYVLKSPTRSDKRVFLDALPCLKKRINYKVSLLRICNFMKRHVLLAIFLFVRISF